MDTATATPTEIDSALAEIYGRMTAPAARIDRLEAAAAVTGRFAPSEARIASLEAAAAAAQLELDALLLEAAPFEDEFAARGGWTRAFLCLSSNGHVHSSRSCSTTHRTTQFGWLPQVSGHDEAEIVSASGEGACTVCYPTAPAATLSRPRTLLHVSEVAAAEERAAKAARKAELEAKRTAKALHLDLTGFGVDRFVGKIETLAAAKAYLTDAAWWVGNNTAAVGRHPYYPADAVHACAEAVAGKLGTDADVELAAAAKRSSKRR
jgi:hypothetical protein